MNTLFFHYLNIIEAEIENNKIRQPLRILDLGCGDGKLMLFLHKNLSSIGVKDFSLFGLEVTSYAASNQNYFNDLSSNLKKIFSADEVKERVAIIGPEEAWPYESEFFHCIISNQVMEHVSDKKLFLSRILEHGTKNFIGINSFPLNEIIIEPHINQPLIHRFKDYKIQKKVMRLFQMFGKKKLREHMLINESITAETYFEYQSDYLNFHVFYSSESEIFNLHKGLGLKCTRQYDAYLPLLFIRRLTKRNQLIKYNSDCGSILGWITSLILKKIYSATFVSNKVNKKKLTKGNI